MNPNTILQIAWNLSDEAQPIWSGVNKSTWRVGTAYWLSRVEREAEARVQRESTLYRHLSSLATLLDITLQFPTLVPTTDGQDYYVTTKSIWRLSRHLLGEAPDPQQLHLYPAIAAGLSSLHSLLASSPVSLSVVNSSLMDELRRNVYSYRELMEKVPDRRDLSYLQSAADYLEERLWQLEQLDTQLIHGDFSHPNLRVLNHSSPRLTGVIDFEFCSVDPPIMDLATIALTILVRSKTTRVDTLISQMLVNYEQEVGSTVSRNLLEIAMVARKFDSYWYHCNRFFAGKASEELLERQSDQIRQVLSFVKG